MGYLTAEQAVLARQQVDAGQEFRTHVEAHRASLEGGVSPRDGAALSPPTALTAYEAAGRFVYSHIMPDVTLALALVIFSFGAIAGGVGALLGIGGGMFLVPLLHLTLGFPLRTAAAVSLATVIATSSSVSAGRAGEELINLRLGTALEVATVGGSLLGGISAGIFTESALQRMFGVVAIIIAATVFARVNRRNVSRDPSIDPGRLGGRFFEAESGGTVAYRVTRLPLALVASFLAGNLSSLLGVGGGVIKVPVLNAWCGVPIRAAAATSALMIGVTAMGGAIIYYGHGDLPPLAAAPAVLGVQLGSWTGLHVAGRASPRSLKALLGGMLLAVGALMLARSMR